MLTKVFAMSSERKNNLPEEAYLDLLKIRVVRIAVNKAGETKLGRNFLELKNEPEIDKLLSNAGFSRHHLSLVWVNNEVRLVELAGEKKAVAKYNYDSIPAGGVVLEPGISMQVVAGNVLFDLELSTDKKVCTLSSFIIKKETQPASKEEAAASKNFNLFSSGYFQIDRTTLAARGLNTDGITENYAGITCSDGVVKVVVAAGADVFIQSGRTYLPAIPSSSTVLLPGDILIIGKNKFVYDANSKKLIYLK